MKVSLTPKSNHTKGLFALPSGKVVWHRISAWLELCLGGFKANSP